MQEEAGSLCPSSPTEQNLGQRQPGTFSGSSFGSGHGKNDKNSIIIAVLTQQWIPTGISRESDCSGGGQISPDTTQGRD